MENEDDLSRNGRHPREVRTRSLPRITWSRQLCFSDPENAAGIWLDDQDRLGVDNTLARYGSTINESYVQHFQRFKDCYAKSHFPQQFDSKTGAHGRVFPKTCLKSIGSPKKELISYRNRSPSSGTSSDSPYPQHHLLQCSGCLITTVSGHRHPLAGGSCTQGAFCRHRRLRLLLGWLAVVAVTLDYFYLASSSCDIYFLGIKKASPFLPRRWAAWFKAKMSKYMRTKI